MQKLINPNRKGRRFEAKNKKVAIKVYSKTRIKGRNKKVINTKYV